MKVLSELLGINIQVIKKDKIYQKRNANWYNIKVSCCRGFYNEFKVDWNNVYYIIHIIHSLKFYKIKYKINLWEKAFKLVKNSYEKRLLNLNAFSYFVRNDHSIALKYLKKIIIDSKSKFEKVNLIAFYKLKKHNKKEALKYIESKYTKKEILKLNYNNVYCNLLAKNYSSISQDYFFIKKVLLKCYKYSKNNVDLIFELLKYINFNKKWKKLLVKMNDYGYYDNRVLEWMGIDTFSDYTKLSYVIFNYLTNSDLNLNCKFSNNNILMLSQKFLKKEVK
ncbi:hypothetical protein [Spiroplasma turonicum]|uniref:Uncharacterized protein n=1 Tax=Spiroplasma turonicum TaxID=216946 RepID=A0A0K1P700_9MOLU|nr:hypothetical protein [Spiroplasma turonicum]AKU80078.1 hypothetical protein STURON_00832 [Spiroplasma turonicum]ALX71079.1 hypothetical protein STURO_v1c08280 [Spiroplasma turonicum]